MAGSSEQKTEPLSPSWCFMATCAGSDKAACFDFLHYKYRISFLCDIMRNVWVPCVDIHSISLNAFTFSFSRQIKAVAWWLLKVTLQTTGIRNRWLRQARWEPMSSENMNRKQRESNDGTGIRVIYYMDLPTQTLTTGLWASSLSFQHLYFPSACAS